MAPSNLYSWIRPWVRRERVMDEQSGESKEEEVMCE